jgi:1-acyl-sn-glycerol-3-phosphate acyltransferase
VSLYGFAKWTLRPLTRVAFDARVEGEDFVPRSGALVVACNHVSYWDPPVLGAWFPRTIHFMAKRELFDNWFFNRLITAVHAFPVERESADVGAIRRALHILKAGEVIGIFPEGRRNASGAAQARNGAVLLAATARCPIVPVALVGTNLAVKRWRGSHVKVRIGEPLRFQGSERRPTKSELSGWTEALAAKIAELTESNADSESAHPGVLLRR